MRVSRVRCIGVDCSFSGSEGTVHYRTDYLFAYAPAYVRYSLNGIDVDFDTEVDCQRFFNDEHGFFYVVCAPIVTEHRIEFDDEGEPIVVGGE